MKKSVKIIIGPQFKNIRHVRIILWHLMNNTTKCLIDLYRKKLFLLIVQEK